jgi:hypothetical protein
VRRSLQRQTNTGKARLDTLALPRINAFSEDQWKPPATIKGVRYADLEQISRRACRRKHVVHWARHQFKIEFSE